MEQRLSIGDIESRLSQYENGTLPMQAAVADISWLLEQARIGERCGRRLNELSRELAVTHEAVEAYAAESRRGSNLAVERGLLKLAAAWEAAAHHRKRYLREDDIAEAMLDCAKDLRGALRP